MPRIYRKLKPMDGAFIGFTSALFIARMYEIAYGVGDFCSMMIFAYTVIIGLFFGLVVVIAIPLLLINVLSCFYGRNRFSSFSLINEKATVTPLGVFICVGIYAMLIAVTISSNPYA